MERVDARVAHVAAQHAAAGDVEWDDLALQRDREHLVVAEHGERHRLARLAADVADDVAHGLALVELAVDAQDLVARLELLALGRGAGDGAQHLDVSGRGVVVHLHADADDLALDVRLHLRELGGREQLVPLLHLRVDAREHALGRGAVQLVLGEAAGVVAREERVLHRPERALAVGELLDGHGVLGLGTPSDRGRCYRRGVLQRNGSRGRGAGRSRPGIGVTARAEEREEGREREEAGLHDRSLPGSVDVEGVGEGPGRVDVASARRRRLPLGERGKQRGDGERDERRGHALVERNGPRHPGPCA